MSIVYIAMSGGVDSSVTAALLQRQGFDARGVFMRYWGDVDDIVPGGADFTNCCNIEAMEDARKVCDYLGIPLATMDLREKFRDAVVRQFVRGYEEGSTPNPCVACNRSIKFEIVERILNEASASERDDIYFATGHYIRTTHSVIATPPQRGKQSRNRSLNVSGSPRADAIGPRDDAGRVRLFTAKDSRKDQSYFLYTLTQEKLRKLFFPIGEYTKPEVRAMALEMKLPVALKKESQEVCFIKHNVQDFLRGRIKNALPGAMVTTTGEVVGQHRGLPFYTIGQREGLGLSGGPYYIASKQPKINTLVVARRDDQALRQSAVILKSINWVSGRTPEEPIRVIAKPRYRHPGALATITIQSTICNLQSVICVFDAPERALTPGQSVVFYQSLEEGMELLGGGIIDSVGGTIHEE